MSEADYETLITKDNIFFQKNKQLTNEYRIVSSFPLSKSTNIIDIVRNNQFFELISKLNSDFISEYTNENGLVKFVFSSDIMREFGDKFALKFTNNINIVSNTDAIIEGASVPYSNSNYSNIFYLNSLKIILNISNNSFNVLILYNIDNNHFNYREIVLVSNFLINIVNNLNLYVCN